MDLIVERAYLEHQTSRHDLALALVDKAGVVRDLAGAWLKHGFDGLGIGRRIDDCIDALVGLFPVEPDRPEQLCMPLIQRPDGRYIELVLASEVHGVLVSVRDVTATGLLSQEAMQARNELLLSKATLAQVGEDLGQTLTALRRYHRIYEHEVRNAAQNVEAAVEMLARHHPSLRDDPYLQAASLSALALVEALNAALEVQRAEAGRGRSSVVPAALARDLVREFRPLAQLKDLALDFQHGQGTEAPVPLDPFRLRLILVNLLANALKFTSRGWIALAVECLPERGELVFTVSDTGPGLDLGVLRSAMGGEAAASGSATTKISAMSDTAGIGLYLCHHLTRSMHGRLEADTQTGCGTVVRTIFPV